MPGSTLLPPCIVLYWPCFPRFACIYFFWLDREGVWRGVILSIKHCAQEHAVENTFGRHRLDYRIAIANFTFMLIHILFCHQYRASTIFLAHLQYNMYKK